MSRGDVVAVVCLTMLGLLFLFALACFGFESDDCQSRGGVMVRTFPGGYICAKVQQ